MEEIIHCRRLCSVSLLFLDALSGFLPFTCHLLSALIIMPRRSGEFESETAEEARVGYTLVENTQSTYCNTAVKATLHSKGKKKKTFLMWW